MQNLSKCFIVSLFLISLLFSQTPIDISGTVINQADFPVKNLVVLLAEQGLADTTDTNGVFEIIGEVTSITNTYLLRKPEMSFRGSNLILNITDRTKPVSLDIYTLKGALVAPILKNKILSRSEHSISLAHHLRNFSSSVLIGMVKLGSDSYRFRLIKTGNAQFAVKGFTGSNIMSSQTTHAFAGSRALDSLKFFRNVIIQGVEEELMGYSFEIDKWVDEFEVTLDLIPYEAVDFGVQEFNANRIWPDEVGDTLTEYPNAIRNYLDKTGPGPHDYQWWCSEYYSYALRVGGCPFYSSSSNPTWMIDGNTGIRTWFRNNSEYIEQNDIGNFIPLPGDFCHIEGHSAMVWYIDDNDSLYTVEANGDLDGDGTFDNQMALVNRGNYKNFTDLLGYGQRTGFVGSSHTSISK